MNNLGSGRNRVHYSNRRIKRINDYSRDPWDRFLGRLANATGVLCFAVIVVWALRVVWA